MTREELAQNMAKNLTLVGIEGQIQAAMRQLADLDAYDRLYGEAGAESRESGRAFCNENLAVAQRALEIRKGF